MIGETLGNYLVLSAIGKGGMGEVYLAEHTVLGRRVAIKVLLRQLSMDVDLVKRFFNEARAAAKLHHPGLVEVFDFGHHTDGSAYIVMELLVGEALSARITRERRIAPAIALAITRQVATALEAAHQQGIVHRDLKPENLFLLDDPDAPGGVRVKVLDFGIAKLAHDDAPRSVKTKTGAVFGTPRYMAPEQCKNAGNVDGRSDIYALGCILFEMLLGRAPFDFDSWGELVAAHIHVDPPRPRDLDPAIPAAIEALVMRTLAKSPDDRYASMAEFADAIDGVWRNTTGESRAMMFTPPHGVVLPRTPSREADAVVGAAPTLPVVAELTTPPPKPRHLAGWLGLGTAVVVGGGLTVLVLLRGGDARPVAPSSPSVIVPAADAPVVVAPIADAAEHVEPTKVELVVESIPSGADVYRQADGVRIGKTPFTHRFDRVDDGEIDLLIKRPGYQDKHVALSTARDGRQVAKLVPVRAAKPGDKPKAGSGGPTFLDPYGDGK